MSSLDKIKELCWKIDLWFTQELQGVAGKGNTGPKWRNELFGVMGPVQKEKDVRVGFFSCQKKNQITADASHHLNASLRKGGGPPSSGWRRMQVHGHRCQDFFSPRQQPLSLPCNIWVYLNMLRMYVLHKYAIRNRGNLPSLLGFPGGSDGKEPACNAGDPGSILKIPWRRAWQPTPVFLPAEFHAQRNLVGYSPWGLKGQDMIEWLTLLLHGHRCR